MDEHAGCHYHLVTRWQFDAPLEAVWDAIYDAEAWPTWWPGLQRVESLDRGAADGLGARQCYVWQSVLPYRLTFVIRVTQVERLLRLEGLVEGDLDGIGCWHFSQEAGLTTVCFDVSAPRSPSSTELSAAGCWAPVFPVEPRHDVSGR